MKKLSAAIRFECMTSFKYIWIFYGMVFLAIATIWAIVVTVTGNVRATGTNCLEMNTVIYAGILGVISVSEDFKMLIQNGFTRTYIFIATVTMFGFITATMAFVDTLIGNVLHRVSDYNSAFGGLYGYENIAANWLGLFLLYMCICLLFYFVVLVIQRIKKKTFLAAAVSGILTLVLVIPALFRTVLSKETVQRISEVLLKAVGFMPDGSVNLIYPAAVLLVIGGILGLGSYLVIRKTEVKG